MSGGLDAFSGMTNLFKNGASKLMDVGGDAVGFVGGAASKVGGAVVSTTSVVAGNVVKHT
jgi:hypothetical protein